MVEISFDLAFNYLRIASNGSCPMCNLYIVLIVEATLGFGEASVRGEGQKGQRGERRQVQRGAKAYG
jgi:hypothetical protein